MKTVGYKFSDGIKEALVAETIGECVRLWLKALFSPSKYCIGRVNDGFCIWYKPALSAGSKGGTGDQS